MSELTQTMNTANVESVRRQILRKMGSEPSFATSADITSVTTDYDTFPYPRWYRGVYYSDKPIVAEREAGFRQRYDKCYKIDKSCDSTPAPYPNHCFEAACSTVHPCYPEYLAKYADQAALDVMLNKACVLGYR